MFVCSRSRPADPSSTRWTPWLTDKEKCRALTSRSRNKWDQQWTVEDRKFRASLNKDGKMSNNHLCSFFPLCSVKGVILDSFLHKSFYLSCLPCCCDSRLLLPTVLSGTFCCLCWDLMLSVPFLRAADSYGFTQLSPAHRSEHQLLHGP